MYTYESCCRFAQPALQYSLLKASGPLYLSRCCFLLIGIHASLRAPSVLENASSQVELQRLTSFSESAHLGRRCLWLARFGQSTALSNVPSLLDSPPPLERKVSSLCNSRFSPESPLGGSLGPSSVLPVLLTTLLFSVEIMVGSDINSLLVCCTGDASNAINGSTSEQTHGLVTLADKGRTFALSPTCCASTRLP